MGSKGSQTTTQTTTPNPEAMAAYSSLLSRTGSLANIPFTPFTPGTAAYSLTPEQMRGMEDINHYAGVAQPLYAQAAGLVSGAANPLSPEQIQQYYSPYQKDVIAATEAEFNNQNQQQLQAVKGNAIAQGALGGDREAIAEAATTHQQQLAQAPVIAGLENQGYAQALATAAQQFQQNPMMAAYGLGNIAAGSQTAGLQGAGAEMGAGATEQQQAYAQYLAQQGYPFQVAQLMAGITTSVGSQMGGTSQTIAPPPNTAGQIAGLGIAGLGAAGQFGSGLPGWMAALPAAAAADGGRIEGYADGGSPFGGVGYVPAPIGLGGHSNMPAAPKPAQQQSGMDIFNNAMKMASNFKGSSGGLQSGLDALQDARQDAAEGDAAFPSIASDSAVYADGGNVQYPGGLSLPGRNRIKLPMRAGLGMPSFVRKGYDDGGSPIADDFSYFDVPKPVQTVPVAPPGLSAAQFNNRFSPAVNEPFLTPQYNTIPSIEDAIQDRAQDANYPDRDFTPDLPKEITGPTEIADQGLGASSAFAPEDRPASGPSSGFTPMTRPQLLENQGRPGFLGLTPEGNMGLIAMGLGMASAASRPGATFAGSIGEGGLAGLGTYAGYKNREADIEMKAAHLDQLAKQEADRMRNASRPYEEMTAHEKAALAQQERIKEETLAQQRELREVPVGYRRTDKGLEPIPGGPADPTIVGNLAEAKMAGGKMSDAAIDLAVDRIRAGDRSALQNLGRGAQTGYNLTRIQNRLAERAGAEGWTGADIAAAQANFASQAAAARTMSVRQAQIEQNVEEAKGTFDLAEKAMHDLGLSQFRPWNKLAQLGERELSNPQLKAYVTALRGAVTGYSQAMSRTGVNSVHAQQAAEELLDKADGPEATQAALNQMRREMDAAIVAPEVVRQRILARISGHGAPAPTTREEAEKARTGAAPGFTGRTATGPGGKKLRETTDGRWIE